MKSVLYFFCLLLAFEAEASRPIFVKSKRDQENVASQSMATESIPKRSLDWWRGDILLPDSHGNPFPVWGGISTGFGQTWIDRDIKGDKKSKSILHPTVHLSVRPWGNVWLESAFSEFQVNNDPADGIKAKYRIMELGLKYAFALPSEYYLFPVVGLQAIRSYYSDPISGQRFVNVREKNTFGLSGLKRIGDRWHLRADLQNTGASLQAGLFY